jgi:hypothetical protein
MARAKQNNNVVTIIQQQPVATPAAAETRLFVAGEHAPGKFSIVTAYGMSEADWATFVKEAVTKVALPGEGEVEVSLDKDGMQIGVSSLSEVQANDKLILSRRA